MMQNTGMVRNGVNESMNNIKNKFAVIIVIVVIFLIILGFVLYQKDHSSHIPIGVGGDSDKQKTWNGSLYIRFSELFDELFPNNDLFQVSEDNELRITLNELKDVGMDISEFNTDTIHCDLDKSYATISYDSDYQQYFRSFYLDCTNDLYDNNSQEQS